MRYIRQKLWDIFAKPMGNIRKTLGCIGKNYGIYWAKTIDYIMGYIWQKLWIFLVKMWDILWDILVKNC